MSDGASQMPESSARALARVSGLVAEARGPEEILSLLVAAAVERLGADGAAALRVTNDGGLRVVAARDLPGDVAGWSTEAEVLGDELGEEFRAACGPKFAYAEVLPLVADGNLYGVLVLLASSARGLAEEQLDLAQGLVDLAAVAIGKAVQYAKLERAYKELEASREALARSEKLRALGQMAAGVSHDLKNILNPLGLEVQFLRRLLHGNDRVAHEVLSRMEDAIRTGSETIERLRSFSRQEPERAAEPTDVNRATEAAIDICMPRIREQVGIELRRERAEASVVLVRATELASAVVNLLMNALDAMPSAGRITVSTGAADGGAWVEVADDGPGMPPEVERRVFEPFFTTKPQGTGLGLPMVYALAQRHSGRVALETAPGRGTRVKMWFPAGGERAVRPIGERGCGGRRLLVVEDDAASRTTLQTLLKEEGFTVDAAGSAEEAVSRLEAFEPDVLLVDFQMPGMDGVRLAHHARKWRPELPVVLMSGFDESRGAMGALLREPRTEHLLKPVDVGTLVAALERVLKGGPA